MIIKGEKTGKEYYLTVGLEVHAEMKTKTKMFCRCKNDPFASEPNTHICPVCTAQPGALPFVNKEAVKNVMKVGVALGGKLADFSEFDRKNYFYPDIPKAYQISQYQYPLVSGGSLLGVELERIHMEEDTATSIHKDNYSLVDFNRSGVPLMELVTKPTIHSAELARDFAKELQLLLRSIGVSGASLEKGEMRIEANVSVSEHGYFDGDFSKLGIKTEVKNLNSFKIVAQAIEYEAKRHVDILEGILDEALVQETRGWDENKQITFSQRSKENADDYRYFPDPDIPKYRFSELKEFSEETLRAELPELPREKRERYKNEFNLKEEDIEFYLQNPEFDKIFQEAALVLEDQSLRIKLSNYISSDLAGYVKNPPRELEGAESAGLHNIDAKELAKLLIMQSKGELSSRGVKDAMLYMYKDAGSAENITERYGLTQKSDEKELKALAKKIIEDNPSQVEQYKSGEEKLLQYFIGQAMKATRGSANPALMQSIFKELLG